MKTKDLTVVVLRLYALLLFFDCVQGLYRLFFHWHYPVREYDSFGKVIFIDGITSVVFCIVVGILLLKFSERIATWVIPATADEGSMQIDSSALLRMALGLAGAIFLVNGVKSLAHTGALWYFLPVVPISRLRPDMPLEQKAKLLEALVLVISGLLLFVGKSRLADFIRGIQKFGVVESGSDNGQVIEKERKETSS